MKRMWWIVTLIIATIIVVAVAVVANYQPDTTPTNNADENNTLDIDSDNPNLAPGRYVNYSESLVEEAGFDTTILFFYAGWCPECRAFDQTILDAEIPDGVQILKVDYDSSQDLRQQHDVTIQSSFVRVDSNSQKLALWNGYGKEKSLEAILANTK